MLAASVVIPTFQRELQLRRTLAALDRQSVRGSFEIIVVDDGSVPDTRRMLSDLSLTVPLRMHWHPHAGFRAAKARNTGVLFAQGELVIFVDDDMLVPPDFVASHLEFHENHDECVAIGYRRRVPYDVWSRQEEEDADALATEATPDTRIAGMADGTWAEIPWAFFNTCHGSVRRRALFDAGLFDETFVGWGFEDTELAYRLSQIGMSFAVLDEPVPLHLEAKDADVRFAEEMQALLKIHADMADIGERIDLEQSKMEEYRVRMTELQEQILTLKGVPNSGQLMGHLQSKLREMSEGVQKGTIAVVDYEQKLMLARIRFQDGVSELRLGKPPQTAQPSTK